MKEAFRPSAVPLVTVDPYFSIWSFSDSLAGTPTRHWTGRRNGMNAILRYDGESYILMGDVAASDRDYFFSTRQLTHTRLSVTPTSSVYEYDTPLFNMQLIFRTPLLLKDRVLVSRPVSYISYVITPKEPGEHTASFYFDITAECCIEHVTDTVRTGKTDYSLYVGNTEQKPLHCSGDGIRIDWGYLHLCRTDAFLSNEWRRREFYLGLKLDLDRLTLDRVYPYEERLALAAINDGLTGMFAVAYDDLHSINYYGDILDAYYKTAYKSFDDACRAAVADFDEVTRRCEEFDRDFTARMLSLGEEFAEVGALAYRQAIAAHKLVTDKDGKLLFLSKECYSNGCIATLDVTYPSIPLFLLFDPEYVKGMLRPMMRESERPEWIFPYAPHDAGQYPLATGQVYSTRDGVLIEDHQMPVEECGNFILTVAAICRAEGSLAFAEETAPFMKKWADYLVENGYRPKNQLCTDDFAGHLPLNCNLSLKAIAALAAYGQMTGDAFYTDTAQNMARRFAEEAKNTEATRLTFDREDSWSMKYNLVWDRLLGLSLFPEDFYRREQALYEKKCARYGVPLDCRKGYTKIDWLVWTTVLCENKEYESLIYRAIHRMVSETPRRVPITDWYETEDAEQVGFQNRTVLGGIFIGLLAKEKAFS